MQERGQERLLTFLLLPAIVVAVLVLSWFSLRASFQLEELRDRSVVEATLSLANEKAQRLDQMIVEQDNAVAKVFDASRIGAAGARWIEVAEVQTPTVRAVLVLDLGSLQREVVTFVSRAPGPEDDVLRRLLVHSLLGDMELTELPHEQLRHLHKTIRGQSHLVSYWQRAVQGREYLVVAWHDVARIVHDYFPALYQEDSKSRVNVVDSAGRIVHGPPLSGGEFTLGLPFETTLYKWRVNVALTSAEELASSAARRRVLEMVLAGLSGLVVIAGIIVVIVAVARERRLANLKSEFVANVSHDLKTPLSLVRMFGELLQSGRVENDEKRRKYIDIIVSESERLGALIENVLDFARVERGEAAYEFEDANISEVVTRAVEACRMRAEQEGLKLELSVPPTPPHGEIDERAVEIAIINLVDNAVKYARDGGVVQVAVETVGASVEIVVADRGPGIAPDDHKRIFDRFVRGAGSKQVRGSGIGLALVKHICEAHRGSVRVEPGQPSGSRFVMTLRL